MPKGIDDTKKKEICESYKNTPASYGYLSKKYEVCERTIYNVLRKEGIKRKDKLVKSTKQTIEKKYNFKSEKPETIDTYMGGEITEEYMKW
jgi:DNA-directed RNA polymerase alpha subunit